MKKLSFKKPGEDRKAEAGGWGEEEYLRSFLQGEERGFDHIFRTSFSPLCYLAFGLLGSQQAAEDVVSDAFLKLWERRSKLDTQGSIRSYLYTTVHHTCIDILRREKRKGVYQAGVKAVGEGEDRPVLHRIVEAETMHRVYSALQTLPPKCGRVVKMYYLEEKSLLEIATELNLSLSTVKSQKGRALELLKKRVGTWLLL